jgi:predicted metal-dependent phosphoesterase TrpH
MEKDLVVGEMAKVGLTALEVIHPRHDAADRGRYQRLCEKYGLVASGGSDSHGERTGYSQIGDGDVPRAALEGLRAAQARLAL